VTKDTHDEELELAEAEDRSLSNWSNTCKESVCGEITYNVCEELFYIDGQWLKLLSFIAACLEYRESCECSGHGLKER